MNQEYTRQIVKRLRWLSDLLSSEVDSRSKFSWHNHFVFIDKRIDWLTNEVWVDRWLFHQHLIAKLIKTDPFLPKALRVKIADYYEKRASKMADIYCKVMIKFCEDLYNGKLTGSSSKLKDVAWKRISGAYFKGGWNSEKAENKVNEFRADIEKYLIELK